MTMPSSMTVADLQRDIAERDDVLVLDVRTPAEYETAHVPGSVNVPVDLVEKHAAQIGAAIDRDVALICRTGPRARRAQQALAAVGLTHARVVNGGFEAWRDAGFDAAYGEPRWDLERQVRLVAGALVTSGVLASTVLPKAKWLSAGVGGGLMFAALSNTCAMGNLLMKLPYNAGAGQPTVKQAVTRVARG